MATKKTTTTLNPLHFEDLEPKRFEDLIRQLAYDFRDWSDIEDTGSSGSDGNFDARAWVNKSVEEDEETSSELWLIQCKRELSITPAKAEKYAKEIAQVPDLHGVLFVASCDLSLTTRNKIRQILGDAGIQEVSIWSRGDIEDRLFQAKYDHLLFAYFGISLFKQQRSKKTAIRSTLATKKRVLSVLGMEAKGFNSFKPVLLRNALQEDYPNQALQQEKLADNLYYCKDVVVIGAYYGGIVFQLNRYHALLDKTAKTYEIEHRYNLLDNMFAHESEFTDNRPHSQNEGYCGSWFHKRENAGYYSQIGFVPYENILAIDDVGDEVCHNPHIYIQPSSKGELFRFARFDFFEPDTTGYYGRDYKRIDLNKLTKVTTLPKRYPKPKPYKPPEV